jgi:hypothetical protein
MTMTSSFGGYQLDFRGEIEKIPRVHSRRGTRAPARLPKQIGLETADNGQIDSEWGQKEVDHDGPGVQSMQRRVPEELPLAGFRLESLACRNMRWNSWTAYRF